MALLACLPSSLLFVVCSFLTADAIEFLSATSQGLHTECTKPGAWRYVHLVRSIWVSPMRDWLRKRITRSADQRQLKSVAMNGNQQDIEWLMRHVTLESVRLVYFGTSQFVIHGVSWWTKLRVLDISRGTFLHCYEPLPASVEIVRAAFRDSLACLTRCQKLRVLELRSSTYDLAVLPNLSGMRDLTLGSALLPWHLHDVVLCTQLVALRMLDTSSVCNLSLLDRLPPDGLRTLRICGTHADRKIVFHFTHLQTLHLSHVRAQNVHLVARPSLLRLNISHAQVSGSGDLLGLQKCTKLQELHIAKPVSFNFDSMYLCRELRVLDLRGIVLRLVDRLVNRCQRIELLAVRAEGRHLAPLRRLPRLRHLDVTDCNDVDLSVLLPCPSLRYLTMLVTSSDAWEIQVMQNVGVTVFTQRKKSYWDEDRPFANSLS